MREHKLKTWPSYFDAVLSGRKTFEVRVNDRDFAEGDVLVLQEWEPNRGLTEWACYTGREVRRTVSYVMHGGRFGLDARHVIMGLAAEGDTTTITEG